MNARLAIVAASRAEEPPLVTSRPRVLASLGAGIATVAAGCCGVTGERRSYEEGSVGDGDGEPRTVE